MTQHFALKTLRIVINSTERFIGFLQKQYCYQWLLVKSERVSLLHCHSLISGFKHNFSSLREKIFQRCQSLWPNLTHRDSPLWEMLDWEQQRISILEFVCHLTKWKQDIFSFCWEKIFPIHVMLSEVHVWHCSIYSKHSLVKNLEYGSFEEMSYMFYSQESI